MSILDFILGDTDAPEWRDVNFNTNLGLNEDTSYYNYDPNDLAGKGYAGALAAGERSMGLLGRSRQEAVNRQFKMASSMIPGQAAFMSTPKGQGISGGTSSVLGRMNFMDAQKRGQEWAGTQNTTAYDLAEAEMPLRAVQAATPFMGMKQEAQKFAYTGARGSEAANKQFRADTMNFQTQFNKIGRVNQENASWQARQSRNNSLLAGLFKVGTAWATGGLSEIGGAMGDIEGTTMASSAMNSW